MIVPAARLLWLVAAMGLPLAVMAAVSPGSRQAVLLAAGCAAAVAAADAWIARNGLRGIRARLVEPVRFLKDRPARLRLEIAGIGAGPARLGIAWPEGLSAGSDVLTVTAPESPFVVEWPFTPERRGKHTIGAVHVERLSRWGFWEVRGPAGGGIEIHAMPSLGTAGDVLSFRRLTVGQRAVRQVGKGREFEKLREYLPGDGFDEIHWKASARRARPVTKVFQVERTREVFVVLDGSRLTGRMAGSDTRLERYTSAALVMAAAAARHGDKFGLVTFQDRVVDFVPAGQGAIHMAACRRALARIAVKSTPADFQEIATELRLRLRGRALVLFLTDLDDPAASEAFAPAAKFLSARHLVAAATIRPDGAKALFSDAPETVDEVYEQLSGHMAWRALKELEISLRRQGVRFGMFERETLGAQVAGLYADIKSRQLL